MKFDGETSAERGPRFVGWLRRLAVGSGLALLSYGPSAMAEDGRWLYLEFQPQQKQAQVRLVSDGDDVAVQLIKRKSNSDCRVQTDGSLLTLSESAGFFPQNRLIGVKRISQGATCGQVRNQESLILALGDDEQIVGQKVREASLSLVIHRKVRILIDARDGDGIVQQYEVRAGAYASLPVDDGVIALTCPIDPGGACQVPLALAEGKQFDSLVFRTIAAKTNSGESGAWSLGGGTSRFGLLYEDGLACGDVDESQPGGTLRRLDDVGAEGGACPTRIPYSLDFDGQTLTFLADYGVLDPGVEPAFAFDVAWRTELVTGPDPQAVEYLEEQNPPELPSTFAQQVPFSVQWFGASLVPEQPYLLDFCPGNPVFQTDVDGNPVLDDEGNPILAGWELPPDFDVSPNGSNDMSLALSGFQFGCLTSRKVELVADESCTSETGAPLVPAADEICVRVKESGYLRGDWTATRTLR